LEIRNEKNKKGDGTKPFWISKLGKIKNVAKQSHFRRLELHKNKMCDETKPFCGNMLQKIKKVSKQSHFIAGVQRTMAHKNYI